MKRKKKISSIMACPKCGSRDIDVTEIQKTTKSCGSYIEEGAASCNLCNYEFKFRKIYDLILNRLEYK